MGFKNPGFQKKHYMRFSVLSVFLVMWGDKLEVGRGGHAMLLVGLLDKITPVLPAARGRTDGSDGGQHNPKIIIISNFVARVD